MYRLKPKDRHVYVKERRAYMGISEHSLLGHVLGASLRPWLILVSIPALLFFIFIFYLSFTFISFPLSKDAKVNWVPCDFKVQV